MRVATQSYDYGRRIEHLRELLEAGGFDGAYITAGPNMYYLCGFSAFERGWPIWLSVLLVPRKGEPVLLLSAMHEEGFRGAVSWVNDVRTYVDGEDPAALLRSALHDTGLASGRLALQDDVWLGDVRLLEAVAPAANIEPGGAVFARLRIVKDAEEIEHLRRVSAIMDAGYAAAHEAIRGGRIEHEVGEEIARALVAAGSERLVVNGHFAKMTARRIEAGDVIDVDLAETSYRYYEGDTGRIYFVGDVSGEHRAMYELVLEAYDATLRAIAPGVPAECVHLAGARVIERDGHVQSWKIGHGVGLTIHEPPFVQQGDSTKLEPGMVFVIDPGMAIVEPYYTTIRVEDMVLVTDNGFEVLSRFTRELLVV
jgi:Xaa-Pro aminopeptidase